MTRLIICPGCGLSLPAPEELFDDRYNASQACKHVYDELTAYTVSLQDPAFIYQFAVDTYTAQHVGASMKPIAPAFALAGLYLTFEYNYSGRQVQRAHMLMARTSKQWPTFHVPQEKAALTVIDVLKAPEEERKNMLSLWEKAVWDIWQAEHARVAEFVHECLSLPRQ